MKSVLLSIIIPCYNEEKTLEACAKGIQTISSQDLQLEIIIVDDASTDNSFAIASSLSQTFNNIRVIRHEINSGKGAALRTGFTHATGDFVAVHDADLEYDPRDLVRLIEPLRNNQAEVVIGSRFLSGDAHRVLYFWHSLGNRLLTFLSNMLTDLNLSDMETCYKVFKREVIQSITLSENRFGFEPEIVAKVAHKRLRVYEIGVSYHGRTYAQGKKIGLKDGFRAVYCILKYNLPTAPFVLQLAAFVTVSCLAALVNCALFLGLSGLGAQLSWAAPIAFAGSAVLLYGIASAVIFRRNAQWNTPITSALALIILALCCLASHHLTLLLQNHGFDAVPARLLAGGLALVCSFWPLKYLVFHEKPAPPWTS